MSQLVATSTAAGLVNSDEIKLGSSPKDTAALKIVVQDFERSVNWLASKQWALRWKESQECYEPIRVVDHWEGTDIPRSSINVFTVAQIVQSLLAKVMEGIYADDPAFVLEPRPGTSQEDARAVSTLLHFEMEDCGFRQELEDGAADGILFGTNIWKVNYEEFKRKVISYKRTAKPIVLSSDVKGLSDTTLHTEESDSFTKVVSVKSVGRPVLESQDIYRTFVNPDLRVTDIRKAKYVISQVNVSAETLNEMRGWEGYEIPSQAELEALLFPREEEAGITSLDSMQSTGNNFDHQAAPRWRETTTDPGFDDSRFEILERWDGNKVMAVLNRKLVIRNEEHDLGVHPYYSVGWWRVPNSFYSMGIGITAGDEQNVQRGLINSLIDEVAFNLNLPYLTEAGENAMTQNIRMYLGKVVQVQDPSKIKPMERIQAVPEAYQNIQASEARAEASSGANEQMVQGATPAAGRTSLGRTATGANLLAGGSGSRLEAYVARLADQVFIPVLNMFFELTKQLMDPQQIREILSEEMDKAWEGDVEDILNARVKFDILAAARMVARQRMAQSLPILATSLLTDPMHQMLTAQGKKVDINELVNMWMDVSGWKNKSALIIDMTEEDEQRAAMQNPGVQQVMANQKKQAGKTDSDLQKIDAQGSVDTTRDLIRQNAKAELDRAAEEKEAREESIITPENNTRAYREMNRQVLQRALSASQQTGNPTLNSNQFGG
jgi:hypothetical protein